MLLWTIIRIKTPKIHLNGKYGQAEWNGYSLEPITINQKCIILQTTIYPRCNIEEMVYLEHIKNNKVNHRKSTQKKESNIDFFSYAQHEQDEMHKVYKRRQIL